MQPAVAFTTSPGSLSGSSRARPASIKVPVMGLASMGSASFDSSPKYRSLGASSFQSSGIQASFCQGGSVSQRAPLSPKAARVVQPFSPSAPRSPSAARVVQRAPLAARSPNASAVIANGAAVSPIPSPGAVAAPCAARPAAQQCADDFMVSVGRAVGTSGGMPWGITLVTPEIAKNRIVVEEIKDPSVLCEWNKAHPDKRVSPGDQIVEINNQVDANGILECCKTAAYLHMRVRPLMLPESLEPWLDAARSFQCNTDFDISGKLEEGRLMALGTLMNVMKTESVDKNTIQAIGDKILLSRLLDNLKVPQMPLLYNTRLKTDDNKVRELVSSLLQRCEDGDEEALDIVVKPTHLSNASGALIFSKAKWDEKGFSEEKLLAHMEKYLAEKAADSESEALKSLIPGFIVQPRYKSLVDFTAPLEMRIVTLWGKARLGIWWWGRQVAGTTPKAGAKPQRTAWIVRKDPSNLDNGKDNWEVLHEHSGGNKGFEVALQLFVDAMPAMAAAAESIAKAIGAPFLRSDFFVGSEKYGVRLNEVAYGSGVDCRRKVEGSEEAANDGPLIARILQEGFKHCQRKPASEFMTALGAEGVEYKSMVVSKLSTSSEEPKRPRLPSFAVKAFSAASGYAAMVSPVAAGDCETRSHRQEVNGNIIVSSYGAVPSTQTLQATPRIISQGQAMRSNSVQVPGSLAMGGGLSRMVSFPSRLNGSAQQSPMMMSGQYGRPIGRPIPMASVSELAPTRRQMS